MPYEYIRSNNSKTSQTSSSLHASAKKVRLESKGVYNSKRLLRLLLTKRTHPIGYPVIPSGEIFLVRVPFHSAPSCMSIIAVAVPRLTELIPRETNCANIDRRSEILFSLCSIFTETLGSLATTRIKKLKSGLVVKLSNARSI